MSAKILSIVLLSVGGSTVAGVLTGLLFGRNIIANRLSKKKNQNQRTHAKCRNHDLTKSPVRHSPAILDVFSLKPKVSYFALTSG